jgi:hypothetical protein
MQSFLMSAGARVVVGFSGRWRVLMLGVALGIGTGACQGESDPIDIPGGDAGQGADGAPADVTPSDSAPIDSAADLAIADTSTPIDQHTQADTSTPPVIWPADATKLVADDHGDGFSAPPPAGSTCQYQDRFTLTVADRGFAWHVCEPTVAGMPQSPFHFVDGQRTLTEAELAGVVAALMNLTPAAHLSCGADKPTLTITVTSASAGEREYVDSFYACLMHGNYVDHIDPVFTALRNLPR